MFDVNPTPIRSTFASKLIATATKNSLSLIEPCEVRRTHGLHAAQQKSRKARSTRLSHSLAVFEHKASCRSQSPRHFIV